MDGRPVAPLLGRLPSHEVGVLAVVTLPNLLLEISPDYAMLMTMTPTSARTTHVELLWLVRPGTQEGMDYDVERLTDFWRLTAEQDWELCERNQRGVNSYFYKPGPYAPNEKGVKHFLGWYDRLLRAALAG